MACHRLRNLPSYRSTAQASVATDLSGGAVSCVVSANGTIGAARIIGHSGIIAAAPPRGDAFPGLPMVLVNRPLKDARGAAAGSGGVFGVVRALRAAVPAFDEDKTLDQAFAALPAGTAVRGRTNAIYCPQGAREEPELCRFATDPAGHGLATSAASDNDAQRSARGQVPPFIVMDVMAEANRREAAGEDVLHLEVGQPSTGAPSGVIEVAQAALIDDKLGYTEALGIDPLRARIAQYYGDTPDIDVAADRVVVTTGSSGGFMLAFCRPSMSATASALADPGYPAYRNILAALGIEAVAIPTTIADRYQPTPELLDRVVEETGALDGLIVASPANPTGTMLPPAEMKALAAYCDANGIRLISDEIYHGITYESAGATALQLHRQRVHREQFFEILFDDRLAGWLGWSFRRICIGRSNVSRRSVHLGIRRCHKRAACAAFECTEELDVNVARYAANRELLLRELPKPGLDRLAPADGAFYIYAEVGHLTNDSEAFLPPDTRRNWRRHGAGYGFRPGPGRATMRISFAGDTQDNGRSGCALQRWLNNPA